MTFFRNRFIILVVMTLRLKKALYERKIIMRSCGVLLHITSLPSPYGIGTFGTAAEQFVDWLKSAKQSLWQVLPLSPTGYGDSPYQSFSAFAGNIMLIDLDDLVASGLVAKEKCVNADYGADPSFVDYEKVYRTKMELLNDAFQHFSEDVGYLAFLQEEAWWLDDYALFMALKESHKLTPFWTWEKELRFREPAAMKAAADEHFQRVNFWKFVQYTFFRQWNKLRRYANRNGIEIVGDIPFYVALDSADVWAHPDLFQLDGAGNPSEVAGVPPDYFSATGQLWGNPLYDWNKMQRENYRWWISRIKKALSMYDHLRIDHFRAFDTYCAIPATDTNAVNGVWKTGPGMSFWNEVKAQLGDVNIIAEDLGEVFDSVKQLMKDTGFPGMRVLQFGFNKQNEDNMHLPHNYPENCVAYTGTHDNDTAAGWYKSADRGTSYMAKHYLAPVPFEKISRTMIKRLYASNAGTVIIPMQDVLGLDTTARMNVPSTLGGNWIWRMKNGAANSKNAAFLADLAKTYFRFGKEK